MKRLLLLLLVVTCTLVLVPSALAVPPALTGVTASTDRHPSATFSAPNANSLTIYFASQPNQASTGEFFQENVKKVDFLTLAEIQTGAWTGETQLDPGTYYVIAKASPSFTPCYVSGGTYRPECANGYSAVAQLVVPVPAVRYSAIVRAPKFWTTVQLKFKAQPLGIKQNYRVCFKSNRKRTICTHGVLDGYSWNSSATSYQSISKHNLPRRATLYWYVGKAKVVKKTFLVQRPD